MGPRSTLPICFKNRSYDEGSLRVFCLFLILCFWTLHDVLNLNLSCAVVWS